MSNRSIDILYNTSSSCVTLEQLLTTSGNIIDYVDSRSFSSSNTSTVSGTAGQTLNQFDVVYLSSVGFKLADYSSSTESNAVGIVSSSGVTLLGEPCLVYAFGEVSNLGWAFTPNSLLFVGASGTLIDYRPTASGLTVKPMGFVADTATKIWLDPDTAWNLSGIGGSSSTANFVIGTGSFSTGGTTITHSLGTTDHFISVVASDLSSFDEDTVAALGNIYVKRGNTQDVVYHTGGEGANSISFVWFATILP